MTARSLEVRRGPPDGRDSRWVVGGDDIESRRWDASGRVVCGMLGNGGGAGKMPGMVGFWMGWGGFLSRVSLQP